MADPALGVRSYLLTATSTAITSIIGSGTAARFFPQDLPQAATMPAVAYETISDIPDHCIGTSWGRSGFSRARIAIDCYAITATASRSLARTIMAYLSGPTGRLRGVYGGVNFFDAMIDSSARTEAESPTDGSDARRYVTTVDVIVSYYDE